MLYHITCTLVVNETTDQAGPFYCICVSYELCLHAFRGANQIMRQSLHESQMQTLADQSVLQLHDVVWKYHRNSAYIRKAMIYLVGETVLAEAQLEG